MGYALGQSGAGEPDPHAPPPHPGPTACPQGPEVTSWARGSCLSGGPSLLPGWGLGVDCPGCLGLWGFLGHWTFGVKISTAPRQTWTNWPLQVSQGAPGTGPVFNPRVSLPDSTPRERHCPVGFGAQVPAPSCSLAPRMYTGTPFPPPGQMNPQTPSL